jgi:hypothetical protein
VSALVAIITTKESYGVVASRHHTPATTGLAGVSPVFLCERHRSRRLDSSDQPRGRIRSEVSVARNRRSNHIQSAKRRTKVSLLSIAWHACCPFHQRDLLLGSRQMALICRLPLMRHRPQSLHTGEATRCFWTVFVPVGMPFKSNTRFSHLQRESDLELASTPPPRPTLVKITNT